MTPEDLARVHGAAFTLPPSWSAADFAAFGTDPACFLVTRSERGALSAFGLFRVVADEAEVLTLATAPHARRKGLARDIMRDALSSAQARGAQHCFLEVAATNHAAILLYQSLGFAQVGLRKAYYRAAGHTALDALVFRAILD
jgi:ribosomal-protein-alanine N-acetyltransferase